MSLRDTAVIEYGRYEFKPKTIFDWYHMRYRNVLVADLGRMTDVNPIHEDTQPVRQAQARRRNERSDKGKELDELMADGKKRTAREIQKILGISYTRTRSLIHGSGTLKRVGTQGQAAIWQTTLKETQQ